MEIQPGLRPRPLWGWSGLPHLEGLYNPIGQQRGGFLLAVLRDAPRRARNHPVIAALRQGPINTNPVLAGYLVGLFTWLVARFPEETETGPRGADRPRDASAPAGSIDRDPDPAGPAQAVSPEASVAETVERARTSIGPLLAASGDRVFWGGVRPVLSLVGILSALLWIGEPAVWYWLGYNSIQLYWRRRSWTIGRRGEEAILEELRGRILERWAVWVGRLGRFLLGLTLGVVITRLWAGQGIVWSGLLLAIFGLGFLLARSGRVPPLAVGWIGVALSGLLALARLGLGKGTP